MKFDLNNNSNMINQYVITWLKDSCMKKVLSVVDFNISRQIIISESLVAVSARMMIDMGQI